MTTSDHQQLKQRIEKLIAEISETLASETTATVELDQSRVGRLSRMDALQGQQMGLAQQRRNEQRLKALHGALRRIETGDYGYCFVCGDEIAKQRLEFDPAVTRCIDCTD